MLNPCIEYFFPVGAFLFLSFHSLRQANIWLSTPFFFLSCMLNSWGTKKHFCWLGSIYSFLTQACNGLSSIYSSRVMTVSKDEISHMFSVRSKGNGISEGMWARVKSGTYKGDLAQVPIDPFWAVHLFCLFTVTSLWFLVVLFAF